MRTWCLNKGNFSNSHYTGGSRDAASGANSSSSRDNVEATGLSEDAGAGLAEADEVDLPILTDFESSTWWHDNERSIDGVDLSSELSGLESLQV